MLNCNHQSANSKITQWLKFPVMLYNPLVAHQLRRCTIKPARECLATPPQCNTSTRTEGLCLEGKIKATVPTPVNLYIFVWKYTETPKLEAHFVSLFSPLSSPSSTYTYTHADICADLKPLEYHIESKQFYRISILVKNAGKNKTKFCLETFF